MYDIDPRWDRANGPASIEPPQRRPHKTVPTAPANGFARGLDLGEVFAGCEHRLSEVTDKFKSKVDRYGEDECWIWNGRLGTGA